MADTYPPGPAPRTRTSTAVVTSPTTIILLQLPLSVGAIPCGCPPSQIDISVLERGQPQGIAPTEMSNVCNCLSHIQQQLLGILHQCFETRHKLAHHGSVDQAMVERECQGHDWAHDHRSVLYNHLLL